MQGMGLRGLRCRGLSHLGKFVDSPRLLLVHAIDDSPQAISGLDFRFSAFNFRVSGLRYRVSGLELRVW